MFFTRLTSSAVRNVVATGLAAAIVAAAGATDARAQLNPYIRGPVLSVNDLRGDFVAAGCALRGTGGSGTITVVGIPGGSFVKEALLYWAVLDDVQTAQAGQLSFANSLTTRAVTGALIGSSASPCGSAMSTAFVYRADVTPWVTGNGSYSITGAYDSGAVGVAPVTEGASLVVIYSNLASANRDIIVYDGAGVANSPGAEVATSLTFFNATSPVTGASICFIAADGEPSLTDSAIVNGLTISANPFDGSDPAGGVDYWDTDTFVATGFLTSGATSVTSAIRAGTDCLVGVATPFSVTSPYPLVDIVTENLTPIVPQGTRFTMRITASNTTAASVPISARIDVYRGPGGIVGTMLQNRGGNVPAGTSIQQNFGRNIRTGVPPGLVMQPLYVLTTITNRLSGEFIDDDYAIMYIQ